MKGIIMKRKIVLILAFLVMLLSAYSIKADISKSDIRFDRVQPASQLATLLRSKIDDIQNEIDQKTTNKGTGSIFYVDSNVTTEGNGESWTGAKDTLDEAVALCADNNGDIIYIAQGHTETWTAADSADLDVIGIKVIGLGEGSDRPTFTYTTGTAGELVIAAANVTIRNLVFQSGIADVVHAIEVEADADGSIIENCEFLSGSTDAYEFVECIEVASAADDLIIRWNKATETTAGATSWLEITAGVCDNLSVYGNEIYGDYGTAVVNATGRAHTTAYFGYNVITNLNADEYAFYFNAAATGVLEHNTIYCDAEATSIDPGSLSCFENYVTTTTDKSGMIYPAPDTGSTQLNATSVTAIATAVDALSGIGMIGLCETNATTTSVVSAALGGFGNDAFLEGWSLICIFDTGGAVGTAPSGEVRDITDYVSTGGTFTTAAWSAALTAGDYVLLTPTHLVPSTYGKIIYCDDGGSDGEGTSWQNAITTLKDAEAVAAAGDTILIGENHNENITTGGDLLNVAGITVIGMGEGDARPLFDFDAAADELTLDAAGITLKNLRFRPGATVVVAGVRVEDAGIGCVIDNCSFVDGEAAATDEFIDAISVDTSAANLTVKNCTYFNSGTDGHTNTFVNLDEATIANASIIDCVVFGDFAEAGIWWGAAVPTNLLVKDNVVTNVRTGQMCIEGSGNATGICSGNMMYADTLGSVLDPGYLKCIENYAATAVDQSGVLVPRPDTIAGKTYASVMQATAQDDNLFDVDGGGIFITSFVGVITTNIVNAAGSVEIKLDADAGWTDYDFSTAVDLDNDQAGQRIVFTNANESVLTPLAGADAGATSLMNGWHCGEGMIQQDNTDEDATGAIKWFMTWIPYDDGTTVTAQ